MNKHENNDEGIKAQNALLTKLRIQSQDEYQKYKDEHQKTNKMYEEYNKKYFGIINNIKDNEEKRINYLSFHIEKFISILKEEKNSLSNVIDSALASNEIDNKDQSLRLQLDEDMKFYKDKFNFEYKPNQRFLEEELLVYDIYRRRMEAIMNNNNLLLRNKKGLMASYMPTSIINDSNLNYLKDTQDYLSKFSSINLEQNDALIYKSIFDNNPLNVNTKLFSIFENKLRNDTKFARTILDKMLCEYFQTKINYEFKKKDQFDRLSQILIDISLNKDIINSSNPIFEINFAIIYIAERGFYLDNNKNKKYLCSVLGEKCHTFKDKDYWKNLLTFKINSNIKKFINKVLKEEGKNKKKGKVQGAVKYLIDIGSALSQKQSKKVKQIKEKKEKDVRYKVLISLLKEFVSHFPNFNLDMPICNDVIMEIGTEYNLEKDEIMYLISFINSNMYSIKSSNIKKKPKSKYLINKINDTNNLKQRQLLLILNSCFMFLIPKDYINIIRVNKFYYNLSEKTIFKHLFLKNDNTSTSINLFDINKHINMWFYYLKYDKKTLKYKEETKKISDQKLESKYIDTINLDVCRTFFDNNQDENRKKLKNILVTLSLCHQKIGYCQGMSYIGQFLLETTKEDEERTFDVFSAILSKANYGDLMIDNFEKMKKYFYVFERLINIYLPDLDIVLKRNNVTASYYITPWFITLFTDNFASNRIRILLRIFDTFVLEGWICIIRVGLLLLKYYQNALIEMKFEEILQFLITDLKEKYDFFNNSNYDKFVELYREMKIPKGLVINIENEYELNKKVEKIKQNYLERSNSSDYSSNDDEDLEENDSDY